MNEFSSSTDNIPVRLIKRVSDIIAAHVKYLIILFTSGIFPEVLKVEMVTASYKNNGFLHNIQNFRPITRTSVF